MADDYRTRLKAVLDKTGIQRQLVRTPEPELKVVADSVQYILPVHTMQDSVPIPFDANDPKLAFSKAASNLFYKREWIERIVFGPVKQGNLTRDFVSVARRGGIEKVKWDEVEVPFIEHLGLMVAVMKANPRMALVRHDQLRASQNSDQKIASYEAKGYGREESIIRAMIDVVNETFATHAGSASFIAYKDKIVEIFLGGSCKSCPSTAQSIEKGLNEILNFSLNHYENNKLVSQRFRGLRIANPRLNA